MPQTHAADERPRALVVDDSPEVVELVAELLRQETFEVETAADGEQAVALARSFNPDIILLDLRLPRMDGLEVCRQIRSFSQAYVVILTVKDGEVDKLVGLAAGADDYVTKPFSSQELIARIHALLRRPRAMSGTQSLVTRTFGELAIDTDAREVRVRGELIALTKIEFDLLVALSSRPNVVFSRELLLETVWGQLSVSDGHVVDVHIAELRKKLGDDPSNPTYIRTVRGVGYRMISGQT